MSMSSRIAPHIPYLRRYARALSGSQSSGDAYVAAVLEALIAEPSLFDTQESPRISLYKLFSSLWQSVEVNVREDTPVSAWEEKASRNLRGISPLPRQAFLLVAVEGFTTDEAATILGVGESDFSELIEQQKPGMVLADIQLADGSSGIDAVNDILARVSVPVIFITAFPERLLTGERPEPTFLVTKPFNPDMVKALISQALFFEAEREAA